MFNQAELWEFIQPYAHSTREILFRLDVARGVAATLEAGGSITTNVTDYEFTCLQVLIAADKFAASVAAHHGLIDRELVFTGNVPGWPPATLPILPMPVDIDGRSYRLRRDDYISHEMFFSLRNEARQALQLESLRSPNEKIPVGEIRAAADKLHNWLRSHMLIVPQLDGVALFEQRHVAGDLKCKLLPMGEISKRGIPRGKAAKLIEEYLNGIGWGNDDGHREDTQRGAVTSGGQASKKRDRSRARAKYLTVTHEAECEGLVRFVSPCWPGRDYK